MGREWGGRVVRHWRWLAALVSAAVALGAAASEAGGAASPARVLGEPFTLASPPPGAPGIGPVDIEASGLGSDGTLWAALVGTPSEAVVVVAHAVDGRTLGPTDLTVAGGLRVGNPVISVSGGTATFAWLAYGWLAHASSYQAEVEARTCTLSGCGPTQTVASWQAGGSGAPVLAGGSPMGIATAGGRTILVFYRNSGGAAQMLWAQAGGGRFGPARPIAAPRLESNVSIDIPVVIAESGGRVLALWPRYGGTGMNAIGWTIWSATSGFEAAQTLTGARGRYSDGSPVAAAVGSGAAIAWIQGDNLTDPEQEAEPIWVSRQSANGFSKPVEAFSGLAAGVSLAGGAGVLALAFTEGSSAADNGAAMVARSVAGAPFGAPVELAPSTVSYEPPTVSVDAHGETLAAWAREEDGASGPAAIAQLALAPAHGTFSPPLTLATASHAGLLGNGPIVRTSAGRAAVMWVGASGSARGAFVSP